MHIPATLASRIRLYRPHAVIIQSAFTRLSRCSKQQRRVRLRHHQQLAAGQASLKLLASLLWVWMVGRLAACRLTVIQLHMPIKPAFHFSSNRTHAVERTNATDALTQLTQRAKRRNRTETVSIFALCPLRCMIVNHF